MNNTIRLKRNSSGELSGEGNISTLAAELDFALIPVPLEQRRSENSPSHNLEVCSPRTGAYMQVGVVWQRTIKRGKSAGLPMFSGQFNDPDLPEWGIGIFPAEGAEEGVYNVQPDRKRKSEDV